jgi:hypothetical protein
VLKTEKTGLWSLQRFGKTIVSSPSATAANCVTQGLGNGAEGRSVGLFALNADLSKEYFLNARKFGSPSGKGWLKAFWFAVHGSNSLG